MRRTDLARCGLTHRRGGGGGDGNGGPRPRGCRNVFLVVFTMCLLLLLVSDCRVWAKRYGNRGGAGGYGRRNQNRFGRYGAGGSSGGGSDVDNNNNEDDDDGSGRDKSRFYSSDPYVVLGLSRTSSPDDIRRKYRSLCLKYHPDKNVDKPTQEERDECEDIFKRVQKAYSTLGDPQSRRRYDSYRGVFNGGVSNGAYAYGGAGSGASNGPYSHEELFGDFMKRYHDAAAAGGPNFPFAGGPAFFFSSNQGNYFHRRHGGDFGNMNNYETNRRRRETSSSFDDGDVDSSGDASDDVTTTAEKPFKSVYVQKVPVSLEDLYRGKRRFRMSVRVNAWTRFLAAFRGGSAYLCMLQTMSYYWLYSFLFLLRSRARPWLVVAALAVAFYRQLPFPSRISFSPDILPGYKGETKFIYRDAGRRDHDADSVLSPFTFNNNANVEIVFIIEELKHHLYRRIGNDLHVNISITSYEARRGCTVSVPSLDSTVDPIQVRIPRGKIKSRRQKKQQPLRNLSSSLLSSSSSSSTTKASSDQTIVLPGRGWPGSPKKGRETGDLIVHVTLKESRRRKRYHRSRRRRSGTKRSGSSKQWRYRNVMYECDEGAEDRRFANLFHLSL